MNLYRIAYIDKAGKLCGQWHGSLHAARRAWGNLESDMTQRPVDIEKVDVPTRIANSLAEWLNTNHEYRADTLELPQ